MDAKIKKDINELRIGSAAVLSILKEEEDISRWINLDSLLNDKIKIDATSTLTGVIVLTEPFKKQIIESCWNWLEKYKHIKIQFILLSKEKKDVNKIDFLSIPIKFIHSILPIDIAASVLIKIVDQIINIIRLTDENTKISSEFKLSDRDTQSFIRIGKLLGQEHDFEKLIRLILFEFRNLVHADSGSIYIIERNTTNEIPTHLRFKSTNFDININEFLLPIDKTSIAGYVALTGKLLLIDDVYKLPKNLEYTFNHSVDKRYSYHTKSMMVVPIKDHQEKIIGVIQFINCKKNMKDQLTLENTQEKVISFSLKDLRLVKAMVGQAGITIENNFLLQDIHNLFEGFVTASVIAIEQRDITTSGHSFRVAAFTVELAKTVDRINTKFFKDIVFSSDQIKEIRYAALLHDFGKVGVKEEVLLKAKKLYPYELELIKWRYYFLKEKINRIYFQNKLRLLKQSNSKYSLLSKNLKVKLEQKLQELDQMFACVLEMNEPDMMGARNFEFLKKMMNTKIKVNNSEKINLLCKNEFASLTTRKGSLNGAERLEIESHVSHTYAFLKEIPWTQSLKNIPKIAHGHHEKLDGSGYPLGLEAPNICIQTRMMTIADIYDALTAPDRPYKSSLPPEKALDIINHEVQEKHIDPNLFQIFTQEKIYETCKNKV